MMKRGIIDPLNMTFQEAIKRVVKAGEMPVKEKKKQPAQQSNSPPIQSGVSPPSSS